MAGRPKPVSRLFAYFAFSFLFSACSYQIGILPSSLSPDTSASTPTSHWQDIALGLQWRTIKPNDDEMAQLKVLRVDPAQYRFRAVYQSREPYTLATWQSREQDHVALVNANFFDHEYRALGLVVSDGVSFGTPYRERGGSLLVKGDTISVHANRSLTDRDWEAAEQAVQGFPLLVEDGQPTYFSQSDTQRTRRTVVAQDKDGRILILVAPFLGLSLPDLSAYLASSDMNVHTAFNLDGGRSTMMSVPDINYKLPSFEAVPAILSIYRH